MYNWNYVPTNQTLVNVRNSNTKQKPCTILCIINIGKNQALTDHFHLISNKT